MGNPVRRKKNKTRNLLLLVLLAVICIGVYVLVHHFVAQKDSETEESTEDASTEELLQVTMEDAVKLTYEYDKQKVVLVKENDIWKLKDNTDYPVDQDLVASMLAVFSNTSSTKTIAENKDEESEYGLDTPLLTATVEGKDGTKTTLTVGMSGIGDSSENYYVTISGKEGIYMTSSGVYTPFEYGEKDLGKLEETPSITSDNIYSIAVKQGSNTTFAAEKEAEDEYAEWSITSPYQSEVVGDATNLSSLASTYTSYAFKQNVDTKGKNDAKYGLDSPLYTVEIKYTEEEETEEAEAEATASPSAKTVKKSFTLFIGAQDGNGNYYVKTSDTDYVYLMSESDAKTYIEVDAFSEVATALFSEELSDVKTIKVKTVSKTKTYTVNTGQEDEDLTALYESITALSYKGEIDQKAKTGDTVLTLELTYGDDGKKTKKFVFTEQDGSYDQVTVDNVTNFVVDKRDVETIISKIK